jgi:hypothetical protein
VIVFFPCDLRYTADRKRSHDGVQASEVNRNVRASYRIDIDLELVQFTKHFK